MASQHTNWILLDECITSYMNESESSNHKYFRFWHMAFDCMMELGLDFFYSIKTVKMPINANLTVNLPADYLNYSKIGVFNQQGEIIPLSFNSKLSTAFDLLPTRVEQTTDNTIATAYNQSGCAWYNYWNGSNVGNLYGLPSGSPFVGSFKIDNAKGVVVLSQDFIYPYLAIEYVASPQEGGEYYLPVQFKQAVMAYLRWRDVASIPVKTHMENSNVLIRRKDYYNERRLAIARYDPISLPEGYEWALKNQRLAIKS